MPDGDGKTLGERPLAGIAVVLSAVAGYIDALGWILLSNVYVANMSGNTVALGRELARGKLGEAAARFWPIVTFTLGLFVSELVYELARRRGRRSSAGWTLGFEAGAIAFVAILPWPPAMTTHGLDYYLPTGLLAFAMGLQNATLIRVGASSLYTTHITGNLTRLAREAAHALLWLHEHGTGRASEQRSIRRVALMTAMWLAYGGAAALGVLAAVRWQRRGGLAAVVVLFVLVAADAFQPIGGHERPPEPHAMF